MAASKLRAFLERKAGEEELEFIIPHPFLPPRFRKQSQQRNMVVLLDSDFTIHVHWEGARRRKWCSLTPRAFRRLIIEVRRKMSEYRKDLEVFGRFIEEVAEKPFSDPRWDEPHYWFKPGPAERIKIPEGESLIRVTLVPESVREVQISEMGGESPLPDREW